MTSEMLNAQLNSLEYLRFWTEYKHKILWIDSLTHLEYDCKNFCCYHGNHFRTKAVYLKTKKPILCRNAVILEKYFSKFKQHEIPAALRKSACFSVYRSRATSNLLFLLLS